MKKLELANIHTDKRMDKLIGIKTGSVIQTLPYHMAIVELYYIKIITE